MLPHWLTHHWTSWEVYKVHYYSELGKTNLTGVETRQRRTCTVCKCTQDEYVSLV